MKRFAPLLFAIVPTFVSAQQIAMSSYLDHPFGSHTGNRHTNVILHDSNLNFAYGGHSFDGSRNIGWITKRDRLFAFSGEAMLNPTSAATMGRPILTPGRNGGVVVGAEIRGNAIANRNAWLQYRYSDNTIIWTRQLDVASGSDDIPTIVKNDQVLETTGAGNSWIAGTSQKNGITRWFLAKYNGSGAFQYLKTGENNSRPSALTFDNMSGDPILTYRLDTNTNAQNRIVRFNSATGNQVWRTGYNPAATNQSAYFNDVAMVNSQIVAVGSFNGNPMFAVFNPTNGARTAQNVRAGTSGVFYRVHPASSSSFYAAGQQTAGGTGIISTYNDTSGGGFVYWFRKFSPSANDIVTFADSTVDPYENLYVVGDSYAPVSGPPGTGTIAARYTFNGTARWTFNYRNADVRRYPASLAVQPHTGQVFISGNQETGSSPVVSSAMVILLSQAPVTTTKILYGEQDVQLTGNAGFNDQFVVGGTFNLVSAPQDGSLELNPDGSFTYNPPPFWTGDTYFTYTVSRFGVTTSQVGRVNITITAP